MKVYRTIATHSAYVFHQLPSDTTLAVCLPFRISLASIYLPEKKNSLGDWHFVVVLIPGIDKPCEKTRDSENFACSQFYFTVATSCELVAPRERGLEHLAHPIADSLRWINIGLGKCFVTWWSLLLVSLTRSHSVCRTPLGLFCGLDEWCLDVVWCNCYIATRVSLQLWITFSHLDINAPPLICRFKIVSSR